MISQLKKHLPIIRYYNGEKKLVNHFTGISYKLRPEEFVRLQFVEFLNYNTTEKASRIGFEIAVKSTLSDSTLRVDLVCYDSNFKPRVLIECKANDVEISRVTAIQATNYNLNINAPYVVLTNGEEIRCFDGFERKECSISDVFEPAINTTFQRDLSYWIDRLFIGRNSSHPLITTNWVDWLNVQIAESSPKLIRISDRLDQLDLTHYYFHTNSHYVTLMSDIAGNTVLVGLLTDHQENPVLLTIDIDKVLSDSDRNCHFRSKMFHKTVDINYFTTPQELTQCSVGEMLELFSTILKEL